MRVSALVLAAGGSRRFGRPKQLLPWRGEPLIRHAARAALGSGADEVVVVLGADADAVRAALADLPIHVALNPGWESGLASSLAAGLEEASGDAVLVVLGDQPVADAKVLAALEHRSTTGS